MEATNAFQCLERDFGYKFVEIRAGMRVIGLPLRKTKISPMYNGEVNVSVYSYKGT